MWPPVTNKGPDSPFQEMGSNTGVTVAWNWDCGWEYSPELLMNIEWFLYGMTTASCLCMYILTLDGRVTEGFSKLDEDLLNNQPIAFEI